MPLSWGFCLQFHKTCGRLENQAKNVWCELAISVSGDADSYDCTESIICMVREAQLVSTLPVKGFNSHWRQPMLRMYTLAVLSKKGPVK